MKKRLKNNIPSSYKKYLINCFSVVVVFMSIFKGLEILAIISLCYIWVSNDSEIILKLRQIISKIGKNGIELRKPPEENEGSFGDIDEK